MLDAIDQNILSALLADSRLSLKELAAQVQLSSPSVSERLRRLEQRGVIKAFTIDIDYKTLGYTLQALIRVKALPGKMHIVQKLLTEIPEVSECDKVTGEDCFVVRIFVRDIEHLDRILDQLADYAQTNTAIIKSKIIDRRPPAFFDLADAR